MGWAKAQREQREVWKEEGVTAWASLMVVASKVPLMEQVLRLPRLDAVAAMMVK